MAKKVTDLKEFDNIELVDANTGELLGTVKDLLGLNEHNYIDVKDDRIDEFLRNKREVDMNYEEKMMATGHFKFDTRKRFLKVHQREIAALIKEGIIGPKESFAILNLIDYVVLNSNVLIKKNNKTPLYKKDLLKVFGAGERNSYNIYKVLTDNLIIAKVEQGKDHEPIYVMNPYIIFNGQWLNHTIQKIFEVYKERAPKDIGKWYPGKNV